MWYHDHEHALLACVLLGLFIGFTLGRAPFRGFVLGRNRADAATLAAPLNWPDGKTAITNLPDGQVFLVLSSAKRLERTGVETIVTLTLSARTASRMGLSLIGAARNAAHPLFASEAGVGCPATYKAHGRSVACLYAPHEDGHHRGEDDILGNFNWLDVAGPDPHDESKDDREGS